MRTKQIQYSIWNITIQEKNIAVLTIISKIVYKLKHNLNYDSVDLYPYFEKITIFANI